MARTGILFILVGPSGAGKNTLMKRVQAELKDLPQLATITTREKRPEEQEGREHVFVSRARFGELIATNALLEYQPVHGGDMYGTPRATVEEALDAGRDLIADIEFLGAGAIDKVFPGHTVLIFVTPSNLDILADRIQQRGDVTPEDLAERLARARHELTFAPRCDYAILNDYVEPAAEHLRQIVVTERARRRGEPVNEHDRLMCPTMHVTVSALVQQGGELLAHGNSHGLSVPTFDVEDVDRLPHQTLQDRMRELLGREPQIEAILDERFKFVAPFHVTVSIIPHDVYLFYYYRVLPPVPELPGWEWHPASELGLPPALARHMS